VLHEVVDFEPAWPAPPRNPLLAQSSYPMAYGDSA
jgi:hypothetical protein